MKKILKVLKIIMIIMIIVALVFSIIVSQNGYHLEICHDEHCVHCLIIHIAQNIISIFVEFFVATIIGALIHLFLSRLRKEKMIYTQTSLVFRKVQLNE